MITKYLHIASANARIAYYFFDNGIFRGFLLPEGLTSAQVEYIVANLPRSLEKLEALAKIVKGAILEQDIDTTFTGFWSAYGYKVGKKARAEKLWGVLKEDERRAAITGIAKYDRYLAGKIRMEKAYPETYLSNRYWENDYK